MDKDVVKKRLIHMSGSEKDLLVMMAEACDDKEWVTNLRAPLDRACEVGDTRMAKKLVLSGAKVRWQCLFNAATNKHWDTIMCLCSVAPPMLDVSLQEVLYMAIEDKKPVIVRKLLDAGAGSTLGKALILAVKLYGPVGEEILRDLLSRPGVSQVIDQSYGEETPLYLASRLGMSSKCSLLLGKGADVNARRDTSESSPTPLYNAVRHGGFLRTVQVLLWSAADPNIPCGPEKRTAVHLACQNGNQSSKTLEALLEHGGNVRARDSNGLTPLHYACGVSSFSSYNIKALVDAGADVNARRNNGRTPLHSATSRLRVESVRALLWYGADETIVAGIRRRTPMDVVGERVESYVGDLETTRELLRRAPMDRRWRRRKCIVMCRTRCTSEDAEGNEDRRRVRRSPRLGGGGDSVDPFGYIVRHVSPDVFRMIVAYL